MWLFLSASIITATADLSRYACTAYHRRAVAPVVHSTVTLCLDLTEFEVKVWEARVVLGGRSSSIMLRKLAFYICIKSTSGVTLYSHVLLSASNINITQDLTVNNIVWMQ